MFPHSNGPYVLVPRPPPRRGTFFDLHCRATLPEPLNAETLHEMLFRPRPDPDRHRDYAERRQSTGRTVAGAIPYQPRT